MLKDISFGRYYPINSVIHKLDPRLKLFLLIAIIVFVFIANSFISLSVMALLIVAVCLLSKVPFKVYLRSFKVILPIIIITSLLNAFYITEGTKILDLGILSVYTGGLIRALFMSVRIILLILISSVLSFTATPTELTDSIESLLSPLKLIGLGSAVHILSMMMSIALRYIPILIAETDKIMSSQRSRGADTESGNLINKIKALVPIIIPLLISSFRRSFELADAMESRCYNGGVGRVRMKRMHLSKFDYIALSVCVITFAVVILINILLK